MKSYISLSQTNSLHNVKCKVGRKEWPRQVDYADYIDGFKFHIRIQNKGKVISTTLQSPVNLFSLIIALKKQHPNAKSGKKNKNIRKEIKQRIIFTMS